MIIPDFAVFRCGQLLGFEDYDRLAPEKVELWEGVMPDLPSPLCWPPPATFTSGRLLSEADYQALTVPPGWQTELYRGVVLAWTVAEVAASDLDLDGFREQAKRWIEQHVPSPAQEANADGGS